MDQFTCLHSQLILQILEHVSIYDKLTSVQFVSKRFLALVWVKYAFQEIDFESEPYFNTQEEQKLLQKYKRNLRKVNFKKYESQNTQQLITILSNCENLTDLNLTNLKLGVNDLMRTLKNLKKLEKLALNEYTEDEISRLQENYALNMKLSTLSLNCTETNIRTTASFITRHIIDQTHTISTLKLRWKILEGMFGIAVDGDMINRDGFGTNVFTSAIFGFKNVDKVELYFDIGNSSIEKAAERLTIILLTVLSNKIPRRNVFYTISLPGNKTCKKITANLTSEYQKMKVFQLWQEEYNRMNLKFYTCLLPFISGIFPHPTDEELQYVSVHCNSNDTTTLGILFDSIAPNRPGVSQRINEFLVSQSNNLLGINKVTCNGKIDEEQSHIVNNLGKTLADFTKLTVLELDLEKTKQNVLETFLLHCKHPELLQEVYTSLNAIPPINEHKYCDCRFEEPTNLSPDQRANPIICSSLWLLARKCPNLMTLYIYDDEVTETNSHSLEAICEMKYLRDLEISDIGSLDGYTFLESIFKNCSHLVKLSLSYVGPPSMLQFQTLLINHIKHLRKLESFELLHTNLVIDSRLLTAFHENIFLQEFCLEADARNIDDWEAFKIAFKSFISTLRYLTLFKVMTKDFSEVQRNELKTLCQHRPGLKLMLLDFSQTDEALLQAEYLQLIAGCRRPPSFM